MIPNEATRFPAFFGGVYWLSLGPAKEPFSVSVLDFNC